MGMFNTASHGKNKRKSLGPETVCLLLRWYAGSDVAVAHGGGGGEVLTPN